MGIYIYRIYPKSRDFLVFLFIVAQIGTIQSCMNKDCTEVCAWYTNPKTGNSFQHVYSVFYKGGRRSQCDTQVCCEQNTASIKTLKHGPGCLATKCVDPQHHPNACDAVELKNVRRQSLNIELQPIYTETCTLPNGNPGILSVCCQPGHIEQYLTLGYAAEKHEFPHQVRLSMGCGGTIYNDEWIITAAHCLVNEKTGIIAEANTVTVKAGSNIETHGSKTYQVTEVHVHDDYSKLLKNRNKPDRNTYKWDIAVVKVNESIKFGPSVKALIVAPENLNPKDYGDNGIIVGWGRSDNYQSPSLLRKSFIQIRDHKVCDQYYRGYTRSMGYQTLCVGGIVKLRNGTIDRGVVAGGGDSGGPAICRGEDGNALLCGITSYGKDDDLCEEHRNEVYCAPSVYASASYFNPWFIEKAGDQSSPTIEFHTIPFSAQTTLPDEHTHQVQVKSSDGDSCGGTLVSKDTVVTAAHCVYKIDDSGKTLRRKGLKVQSDSTSWYKVKQIYTNDWQRNFKIQNKFAILTNPYKTRDVKMLDDYYYDYDIAILKLTQEIEDAEPLQLPPAGFNTYGDNVEVMEIARHRGNNGQIMKREINLISNSDCQVRYNAFNFVVTNENTTVILSSESRSKRQSFQTIQLDPRMWDEILRQLGSSNWGRVEQNNSPAQRNRNKPPAGLEEQRQWLLKNLEPMHLTPREGCYAEKYSGGSTCDRELGGPIICRDTDTDEKYLCGVQTFRLCLSSFPNMFVDVSQFRKDIEKYM